VGDRARLESVVTELFVDSLDVLVSDFGNREKLRCLSSEADLLPERGTSPELGRD